MKCNIVDSELLYKDGSFSDFNGISCDILRSARDQVVRMIDMASLAMCSHRSCTVLPNLVFVIEPRLVTILM